MMSKDLEDYDYTNMTNIDKNNMEDTFLHLPGDVHTVTDLVADQQKLISDLLDEINYIKDNLKFIKAEIEMQYRTGKLKIISVQKKVMDKLTADMIKAVVECNQQVVIEREKIHEKQKELNKEQLDLDKLNGVLKALQIKNKQSSNYKDWVGLGLSSISPKNNELSAMRKLK